jgi:hypothetical protein
LFIILQSKFVHIPDIHPGTKCYIEHHIQPSSSLQKHGFTETTCFQSTRDSSSSRGGCEITNKDVLELYFTATEFENGGMSTSCGGKLHTVAYKIVCDWLYHIAGIQRTPKATNAKLVQLQKQYVKLSKSFNVRCAVKPADILRNFLDSSFEWQEDLRSGRKASSHIISNEVVGEQIVEGGIVIIDNLSDITQSPTTDIVDNTQSPTTDTVDNTRSPTTAVSKFVDSDISVGELRDGNQRLGLAEVKELMEIQTLSRSLQREKAKTVRLNQENNEMKEMVGLRLRHVMKENLHLENSVQNLTAQSHGLKQKQKGMLDRTVHNGILTTVKEDNKQLKSAVSQLTLECETLTDERYELNAKLTDAKKQINKQRMRVSRTIESVGKLKKDAEDAKNSYRLDKEATELYHSGIVDMLQQKVEVGERTQDELKQQLDSLAKLETKSNGIYKSTIRLMYYDLLTQGVSANTIQSVITTVLTNITQIDVNSIQLPSRTTAQRMVSEAGELVKVRAAYELAMNDGALGHHSDGTTKSLIHWGAHVLKLSVNEESRAFTLCVSPVESGKSVDTVQQLKESLSDMKELATMLNLDYADDAFDLTRITTRMSDRAPNEQCVTKLIQQEKRELLEQSATWDRLTPDEQEEKVRVRQWTCAAHKVDNVTNAMTTASQEFLNSGGDKRKMNGAKKLIYETNKLICQHSHKEYSKGKEFMAFALDDGVYQESATSLLKPVVGNRYIIFLLNSIPTLVAKDMILVYLESLRDAKDKVGLNKLEASVMQGYLDPTVEAELAAFAIIFYHVCHPILIKAKGAKSPLEMNWYYKTALRKLGQYADDPSDLLNGNALLWPGADKQTEYSPLMPHVYGTADKHKEMVSSLLKLMADAGKHKLQAHAAEHLPGGVYNQPTPTDQAAAHLLSTATNDIIESCFGVLDRQQMMCPVRNPVNTSAIVTARKDKPTAFVREQEEELKEAMVSTARKSATKRRKEKGTKNKQLLAMWQRGKEERDGKIQKRREKRRLRKQKFDAAVTELRAGNLVLKDTDVSRLKGAELLKQFQLWSILQSTGVRINMSEKLKGVSTLKVAEKKERLKAVILGNQHVDLTKLDLGPRDHDSTDTEGDAPDRADTPDRADGPALCSDDDGNTSSSDEEIDDMLSNHLALGKFQAAGGWVAVAFAGGVWYPGQIVEVKSDNLAVVEYLHPCTASIPYPADVLFKKPNKVDVMDTDNDSVFLWEFTMDPISSSCRQFRSSLDISMINRKYAGFAAEYDIPQ